jgi:LuxR family maltose regulon positive regulatory protein
MSTPILATKLYIPPPPPKAVQRPSLIERLNEGLHRKLTLIAAPAGFGKTTLLSEWVAGLQVSNRPVAWLSLDVEDSDPARFLTYLVAALRTIAPSIGEEVLGVLQDPQAPQPPPTESILTALLNEITTTMPGNFVLVLDDYHVIDAKPIDQALTFLLDHLPPQGHLVITTREDPQLPLPRLRARNQLTELRAADLRFTPSEAAGFLHAMGVSLSPEDVAALERRTEGWIAGLQLAALSMQSHPDIPAFVRAFAGDHRYIADYLVEEVLQRQSEDVRSFLLQTSILDRLTGPLCDAVTGQEGGNTRLMALERGNFFVVPLDDKRQWYRYHHLFAEVLHTHLMAEQPVMVATLHRRASKWYEQNGSADDAMSQAIRHALAAGDFDRAADLVELAVPVMRPSRQEAALLGWLKALPDEAIQCRPVLSVSYALVLLGIGELEGVEDRLRDAERWLNASVETADISARPDTLPTGMVVVDEAAFRRLPAEIAVARAAMALVLEDVADAVKYAQRVLDFVPEGDHLGAGSGTALLGLASWLSGDLEVAHRTFAEGQAHLRRAGYLSDAVGGSVALADMRIAQGRLREAMRTYERGLELATEQTTRGEPILRGAADMHVGMSALYCEHNVLDAATQHLLESKQLGEHNGFPQNRYRWFVAMTRIREARGDLHGALDLLDEAERLYVTDLFPNVRPIGALRARLWVKQGMLDDALGWVRQRGLSVEDDLSYLREFEHITLARLLLAQHKSEYSDRVHRPLLAAIDLLGHLLAAAETGGRTGSVIEIMVLQSLAHHAQGDIPSALPPLQSALTLAAPERYVRIFVDEGSPMEAVLREAGNPGFPQQAFSPETRRGSGREDSAPGYAHQLLAAFKQDGKPGEVTEAGKDPGARKRTPITQSLVEPLSVREHEVLRLLRTELTGPEIAGELMVSLHTMRTHTNNIYIKLGVNNRRAAVRRAEDLGLL